MSVWQTDPQLTCNVFYTGYQPLLSFSSVSKLFQNVAKFENIIFIIAGMSRSFDNVACEFNHPQLERMGISGNLLPLIKNVLHNRYQRVTLNDQFSDSPKG